MSDSLEMVVTEGKRSYFATGDDMSFRENRHAPSYHEVRNILGRAIQRRVHRELGLAAARRMLRGDNRAFTLRGAYFQKVVHAGEFESGGAGRIFRLAEVLGLDPVLEIAKAAGERAA
jgi:hypothetical protein